MLMLRDWPAADWIRSAIRLVYNATRTLVVPAGHLAKRKQRRLFAGGFPGFICDPGADSGQGRRLQIPSDSVAVAEATS